MTYTRTDEDEVRARLEALTAIAKQLQELLGNLLVSWGATKELVLGIVEMSNLPRNEKDTIQHLIEKIAPNGVMVLTDEMKSIGDRVRALLVSWYGDDGMMLIKQIYNYNCYDPNTISQQSDIAGPTGERRNVSPKNRTATSPRTNTPNVLIEPKQDPIKLYTQYIDRCPLLSTLTKVVEDVPASSWAKACGYDLNEVNLLEGPDKDIALNKGVNAFLWDTSNGMSTVQKVMEYNHPTASVGKVFILTMDRDVAGKVPDTLPDVGKVWTSPKYPKSVVVEVADIKDISKRNPLEDTSREKWNPIQQYLAKENPHHVSQVNHTRSRRNSLNNTHAYPATA